ncbi:PR domain zinc finger protein 5-like [Odontomachus brunneus]|uniref:PR domain zinc finger protein 5-like n=1 Tax=Odontomachus brunneus TaxID=486640 RepID=UPI0013F2A73D|nr:PR domain zinc finger protein 5-like [Odontomachus brunneus]
MNDIEQRHNESIQSPELFRNKDNAEKHSNMKNYSCQFCDQNFNLQEELNHHMKIIHELPSYTYNDSSEAFKVDEKNYTFEQLISDLREILSDSNKINDIKQLQNSWGNKMNDIEQRHNESIQSPELFRNKDDAEKHSNMKNYLCQFCDQNLNFQEELNHHMKIIHELHNYPYDNDSSEAFKVDEKNYTFEQLISDLREILSDSNKTNDIKQLQNSWRNKMNDIEQRHNESIQFPELFRNKDNAEEHSNMKNYLCQFCDQNFNLQEELNHHMKIIHELPSYPYDNDSSEVFKVDEENCTFEQQNLMESLSDPKKINDMK